MNVNPVTSPTNRVSSYKPVVIIAPDSHGTFDFPSNVQYGFPTQRSDSCYVGAPYNFIGEGQFVVTWQKGAEKVQTTVYHGDGPPIIVERQGPREITVSYTGKVRGKGKYLLNWEMYQKATKACSGWFTYIYRGTPEDFVKQFSPIQVIYEQLR